MRTAPSPHRVANGPYRPSRDPQVLLLVAIVVGVVGLWVVGVVSPATLAGGESSPVFPFRDQSEDGVVSVSLNESTVDPGGDVTVTVEVDRRPVSDATVRVAGGSYTTSDDGTVVVSVADPGSYEVTGVRPDGNRSTTTALRVRRYETALAVSVADRAVTAETVPVRVTRADGGPVEASVVVDGERLRTGADGVVNVSFDVAGAFEVRATKQPTAAYRFEDATATVAVDRRRVALVASTNRSRPRVDDAVAVSVTRRDTGAPVAATLALGDRTVRTGADGVANVSFDVAGDVRVVASANRTPAVRFVDARTRVAVQRIPVPLAVSVTPQSVAEGDRARFVVRRTDTGERVDATLALFGTPYSTGADGRASFPFYAPGTATVEATKPSTSRERFVAANASFRVLGPEVVATSVSVPATAPANATVNVGATLENVGNEAADEDVVVTVGAATTRTRTTVEAGASTTTNWTVATPNATGTVTVTLAYEEVRVERTVRLVDAPTNETRRSATTASNATIARRGLADPTRSRAGEMPEPVPDGRARAVAGPTGRHPDVASTADRSLARRVAVGR